MGDPDAVSVGDYHLPNAVGWTLARRTTDDDGMLELLAPYAGHRYRVTRLIELGGSRPPRLLAPRLLAPRLLAPRLLAPRPALACPPCPASPTHIPSGRLRLHRQDRGPKPAFPRG